MALFPITNRGSYQFKTRRIIIDFLKNREGKEMADINSFSKVEPEYVKVAIPISFYVPDENLIDPKQETEHFLCPAECEKEPEFVKMVIPISAYEQDEHLSCRDFEPIMFMSMVLNPNVTHIDQTGQPNPIM